MLFVSQLQIYSIPFVTAVGKLPGKKKTKKQKKKQKQQQAQVAAAFNDNDNEADIREQTSVSQAAGSDSEEVDEYAVLEHTLQAATGPIAPSKKSKKQKKKQKQQQAQMAAAADFASSDGEPELEQAAVADSEDEDAVLDRMLQAAQGNQSTVQPQLQKPKAQKKKQKQQQAQIAAADALGNSEGEPDTSQQAADTDSGFEDALLSPRAQASEFVQAAEPSHAQQVGTISCFICMLVCMHHVALASLPVIWDRVLVDCQSAVLFEVLGIFNICL